MTQWKIINTIANFFKDVKEPILTVLFVAVFYFYFTFSTITKRRTYYYHLLERLEMKMSDRELVVFFTPHATACQFYVTFVIYWIVVKFFSDKLTMQKKLIKKKLMR